jgi:hypothetical protein
MVDDVDITAGSGTTIATDDVSGSHYQLVKLADGTPDSSAVVAADSTLNALQTKPRRIMNKTSATGSAAIAATHTATGWEEVLSVTLHFSSAPTTSENLTITLDANDGAAYDTLLYSIDPSASSVTDLVWFPDGTLVMENGDAIDVAYTNTDTRTYGVQITTGDVQ